MILLLVLVVLLLHLKVVVTLRQVRAMNRTAEGGVGEDANVGAVEVDHAEIQENENDLRNHEGEGGEVRAPVVAAAAAVVAATATATAADRLPRHRKAQSRTTKRSNWTPILPRTKVRQILLAI